MDPARLICPCGHTWEHPGDSPLPADLREICPVCSPVVDGEAQTKVASPPSQSAHDSQPGFLLGPGKVIADYEVLGELNRGGMGVIYKAKQKGLDRIVALKVIAPNRLGSREARRRFKQEVVTAARLNHPNIVTVYQTDLDGPIPYLAMEYVPGIDLSKLVKTVGPLLPQDACYYILQAAHGLQHAFEAGLVHRDIKPANLMVTPSPLDASAIKTGKLPRVKILDMGLARVVTEGEAEPGELTRDGVFLGTPDYVAPEQAEDARTSDIRADIYSLGSSLFYLLTAEIPFPGASVVQKLRKQMTEAPPSPRARREEVSPSLDALVRGMMARDPRERPQTPAELIDLMEQVARGGVISGSTTPGTAFSISSAGTAAHTPFPGQVRSSIPVTSIFARAHEGGALSVAVTPDGKSLLSGGRDGSIKLWNALKLKETRTFHGDIGALEQLALAPNGKWAATCSTRLTLQEMRVQLWDLASGTEHGRGLKGAADNYRCVAIAPDGKRLAAGNSDHGIWVWSFEYAGMKPIQLKGHTAPVTGVAFARNADSLLSAGEDGTVRQWDLTTGTEKGSLNTSVGPIKCLAFGGKRVAVAGKFLAVRLKTASFTRFDGHDGPVLCVAFSPDGKLLASGGADGTLRIWNVEDGHELASFEGHARGVAAVAFGPEGGVLFSGGEDGLLRRWHPALTLA
jgi:serine/threonine protein kinase